MYAPWTLTGESIVALARCRDSLGPLPPELRPMPGPVLVVGVHYDGSPVGPYLELGIGEPARLGARLGWCFTTMVVDSPDSRTDGRANWGFPKELGTLTWDRDGDERELHWAERQLVVRGRPTALRAPMLVPVRALQRRGDGPVVVPGRLRGLARYAHVDVEVATGDPFAPLAGRHRGATVDSMRFVVRPARQPFGLTSTLRAPLHAPEPALSSPVPPGVLRGVELSWFEPSLHR
jgi:hypothetical protein